MKKAILATIALAAANAANAATWSQKAAGAYTWGDAANWTDGTLPTAATDALLNNSSYRPTGDQTIAGDGTARSLDLHNTDPDRVRTFTGDIAASNFVLRVGTMNVEGTLTLTGGDETYSLLGAAYPSSQYGGTLDIKSGGAVVADGAHAICVGRRGSADNTDAAGRIFLRDGGKFVLSPSSAATMTGLMLGRLDGKRTGTYGASYVQFGGEAALGKFLTGYEKNTFGTIAVLGGTLDLPYVSTETRFRIGHRGYGVFQLLGGDITVGTNRASSITIAGDKSYERRSWCFEVGSGNKTADGLLGAHFYANAGTLESKLDFAIQGPTWDYEGVAPAYATIAGTAAVTSRAVRVGASINDGLAALNLAGGVLATDAIYAQTNRAGRSIVNADGGKLAFLSTATQVQGLNLDAINIYEGGLEIECGRTVYLGNATTNVILRTPGGYGVDIASVTEIGSSFSVPWIEISGGGGSNACAMALVDFGTSTTTNAVIACRGEGYAADDTVTATVSRPYGTTTFTDRITLSVSENKPGALVKTGGYNLALFAQPEFAGTYHVKQGWMIQTTTASAGSPNVAAVIVGGDDAVFQCGSGNDTAIEANWNPVNAAATLTLGTADGPGTLAIPRSASSESKPFSQTFASLTVNGTGNAITHQNNSGSANGAVVAFGTISCAEGSELTIPHWETGVVKVYVTGMKAGTLLDNIVFEGTTVTAMVGDDGQLVKASKGTTIIVR